MARVHYFQRYSQQENVDTNNTLLLLSRIQAEDPRLLGDVLTALFSDVGVALEIGAQFEQQIAAPGGSIPDATISQPSFRIVVEAKRTPEYKIEQLSGHLSAFGTESIKLLILLTPEKCEVRVPGAKERDIQVISLRFSDIVAACRAANLYMHIGLREIVEDYEEYCQESNLLSRESERLLVVSATTTLSDNLEFDLYYAPADRAFQKSRFLGLYAHKSVQALGELENIVLAADLNEEGGEGGELFVLRSEKPVSDDQKHRIQQAITAAPKHGYDISTGHAFFLVRKFLETDFKKTTPGGLRSHRYFNLREELEIPHGAELPDLATIGNKLRQRSWE